MIKFNIGDRVVRTGMGMGDDWWEGIVTNTRVRKEIRVLFDPGDGGQEIWLDEDKLQKKTIDAD